MENFPAPASARLGAGNRAPATPFHFWFFARSLFGSHPEARQYVKVWCAGEGCLGLGRTEGVNGDSRKIKVSAMIHESGAAPVLEVKITSAKEKFGKSFRRDSSFEEVRRIAEAIINTPHDAEVDLDAVMDPPAP